MQKIATISKAWERKHPEQVVWAITKNAEGQSQSHGDRLTERRHRVCICYDAPPMFLIGIDDNAYTLELIRESKEFVIAYPSNSMAKETLYVGTTHGHNEDKGTNSDLNFVPATKINVPIIADAVANFECRFITEYRPGNCPLLIGEVIASHVNTNKDIKRLVNIGTGYQFG